jgi:hypothetical protein
MADKYFNRREAEDLLPLLEDYLEAAVRQKRTVDDLGAQIASATSRIMLMGGSIPPYAELSHTKAVFDKAAAELSENVEKIQQTGCVVKDLDEGLIDFPTLLEGEEVYLCWKRGEKRIEYWHGLDEGFAGRKRLDDSKPEESPPGKPRLQ